MIVGPWKLGTLYLSQGDTRIYHAKPNYQIPSKDIKEIETEKWLLKIKEDPSIRELNIIEELELYNKKNLAIKMPHEKVYRSGLIKDGYWLAMKEYHESIKYNLDFAKKNLKLLALNILDFLEWLHIEKNKVYNDLKMDNILVDKLNMTKPFVITDYELINSPNDIPCHKDLPNGYYYYGFGCEYDKPYTSYRMDLEALGYLLIQVMLSANGGIFKFKWQQCAFDSYSKNITIPVFTSLNVMKKREAIPDNEVIIKYFNIIKELDWYCQKPNPNIYIKIKEIFQKI